MANAIQVAWTAPERPNGMILQYHLQLTSYDGRTVIACELEMILQDHLQLTSYDGRTVIASDSLGSAAVIGQLNNRQLGEHNVHDGTFVMCPELLYIVHYNLVIRHDVRHSI